MNYQSDSIMLFGEHLLRKGKFKFENRWCNLSSELILTDEPNLSKLWQGRWLRHGYMTVENVVHLKVKEMSDFAIGQQIIEYFEEYNGLDECNALLEAVETMITYYSPDSPGLIMLDELQDVKLDLESIKIFARSADECIKREELAAIELEKHLSHFI